MFNGKKLSEYMDKNGISSSALARTLGVTEGTVRHIIIGIRQPSLALANVIAQMMGCTVDELIVEAE